MKANDHNQRYHKQNYLNDTSRDSDEVLCRVLFKALHLETVVTKHARFTSEGGHQGKLKQRLYEACRERIWLHKKARNQRNQPPTMQRAYLGELCDCALQIVDLVSNCVDALIGLAPIEGGERRIDLIACSDDRVAVVTDSREFSHCWRRGQEIAELLYVVSKYNRSIEIEERNNKIKKKKQKKTNKPITSNKNPQILRIRCARNLRGETQNTHGMERRGHDAPKHRSNTKR